MRTATCSREHIATQDKTYSCLSYAAAGVGAATAMVQFEEEQAKGTANDRETSYYRERARQQEPLLHRMRRLPVSGPAIGTLLCDPRERCSAINAFNVFDHFNAPPRCRGRHVW